MEQLCRQRLDWRQWPEFLRTAWILAQFDKKRAQAQNQYRDFVSDGAASRPWEELKGQGSLDIEASMEKYPAPNKDLKEIPGFRL